MLGAGDVTYQLCNTYYNISVDIGELVAITNQVPAEAWGWLDIQRVNFSVEHIRNMETAPSSSLSLCCNTEGSIWGKNIKLGRHRH